MTKSELATSNEIDALPEILDDQKDQLEKTLIFPLKAHELIINSEKLEDALTVISKNIDYDNDYSSIKVAESNLKTGMTIKDHP